jgi:hypothetical protein
MKLSTPQTIVTPNGRVIHDELETMWKDVVMAYIKVISWNSPEENHKKPQSG